MRNRFKYPLAIVFTSVLVGGGLWMAQNPAYAPVSKMPAAARRDWGNATKPMNRQSRETSLPQKVRAIHKQQAQANPFKTFGHHFYLRVKNAVANGVDLTKPSANTFVSPVKPTDS